MGRPSDGKKSHTGNRPRIVLADDHEGVLSETTSLLESDFEVSAAVSDGTSLMQAVIDNNPDCVIADLEMPGLDGMAAGQEILRRGLCQCVIILSVYSDPPLIQAALRSGIRGYVLKEDAGEELIDAIRAVLAGVLYLSRGALASNVN